MVTDTTVINTNAETLAKTIYSTVFDGSMVFIISLISSSVHAVNEVLFRPLMVSHVFS